MATMVWPYVGVVVLGGIDRALLAAVIACLVAGLAETYRQSMGQVDLNAVVSVALLPISALCFAFAILRSVVLAESRGIRWRGTTYPLELLRAQSGLEGTTSSRSR
jgi:hypothetical protein